MNISIDLGNKYVKAISGDGKKVIFRSVISTGARRHVLSLNPTHDEIDTDTLQVQITKPNGVVQDYYIGKMAERFGTMREYVLGKERYDSESAIVLVYTAAALLSPGGNEPLSLSISLPYDQYGTLGDAFCKKIKAYQATIDVEGKSDNGKLNIVSVTPYEQGLSALYNLHHQNPLSEDDYYAVIDIGGGTTEVIVSEVYNGKLIVHEELSGTFSIGTKDISNSIRVAFRRATGDTPGADITERIIFKHGMFYGGKELDFSSEVELGKARLASTVRTCLLELWGETKQRIRHVYYVGGGAELTKNELSGFHSSEEVVSSAQFANAMGGLTLLNSLHEPTAHKERDGKGAEKKPDANDTDASHERNNQAKEVKNGTNENSTSNRSPNMQGEHTESEKERQAEAPETKDHIKSETGVPKRFVEGQSAW